MEPTLQQDRIGQRQAQWRKELPDLDTRGMAVLGRARRIPLTPRPRIESLFAEHGLDAGEFDVLATLLRGGAPYSQRPTELFRSLMISSGGLTDRLLRLEKAGWVQRIPCPDDARSKRVQLTEAGRNLTEELFRRDMALEAEMLAALSEAEVTALSDLLAKLAASLETD